MKKIFIIFFLHIFNVNGQISGFCYEHSDPLLYGVSDRIIFLDSTFEYEFIEGLASGIVKGKYSLSGDTILITSEYQADNYKLEKVNDLRQFYQQNVSLRIRQIEHSQVIDVKYLDLNDVIQTIKGKTISHSKVNQLNDEIDTVIIEFNIPLAVKQLDKIDVIIWRKNTHIIIPLETKFNAYLLDLTKYPSELDYRFFNNKKAMIIDSNLNFLNEKNLPEKDYFLVKTRKAITISKRKKIKKIKKCA